MLVISSILRLDLYVGIYALTYWRVAAFIWMGLVAVGLVLIIARIALGKSNKWLLVRQSSDAFGDALCLLLRQFRRADRELQCRRIRCEMTGAGHQPRHLLSARPRPGGLPGDRPRSWQAATSRLRMTQAVASFAGSAAPTGERGIATTLQQWRAWTFRDWRLRAISTAQTVHRAVTPRSDSAVRSR